MTTTKEKKEHYRWNLPHYQQPGQTYFVTWILKGAIPKNISEVYGRKLEELKHELEVLKRNNADRNVIEEVQKQYYTTRKKHIAFIDDALDRQTDNIVDLSKPENTAIIKDTLTFWEGNKIANYCFCVMSNHVHWVFKTFEKDVNGLPVYLESILLSVKRFTARQINIAENRTGALWIKESFDTTIRNREHLYNAIEYTLNNPVKAGLVKNRDDWQGCFDFRYEE